MAKLTLNLVPDSCWFSNLRSELPRSDWDRLRRATYRKANYCCEVCGGKGNSHPVECHERWLYDHLTLTQKLDELLALCPACHEVKHFGRSSIIGRGEEAISHYMDINNVDRAQATQEIATEFKIWEARSQLMWDLDLSALAPLGIPKNEVDAMEARRSKRNKEGSV